MHINNRKTAISPEGALHSALHPLWISHDEIHSDEQSKAVVRFVKKKGHMCVVWKFTPYTQLPLLFQNQTLCEKSGGLFVTILKLCLLPACSVDSGLILCTQERKQLHCSSQLWG